MKRLLLLPVIGMLMMGCDNSASLSNYVTFDTARFVNAQRSIASQMMGSTLSGDPSDAALVIRRVSKEAAPTIKKVANGRLVIVKQAVVLNDQVDDITDQVLKELGLPTDVPTITLDTTIESDTNLRFSKKYQQAEKQELLDELKEKQEKVNEGAKATSDLLP